MIKNTGPLRVGIALSLVFVLNSVTWADKNAVIAPRSIEIFISGDQPTSRNAHFMEKHRGIEIRVHTLDAIRGLEHTLSRDLPSNSDEAKRLVLKRLQRLNNGDRIRLEHSATALAKAVQLGVTKYPAIVFDGKLVVYGLTDLSIALKQYRSWQAGEL